MRFIRGHALVHVFISGQSVIGWSTYFYCNFERGPSQGWSERLLLIPYVYTPPLARLESTHSFIFIFTRCISNTLVFRRKLEDSAPLLRSPLSVIFVWRFTEEAPKSSVNFPSYFPCEMACLSCPISSGVSAIVSRFSDHLAARLAALL